MQIVQTSSSSGVNAKGAGTARVVDDASAAINGSASARSEAPAARSSTASLQRGLSNWDHQLQGEISNAQQTLDYLERSSSQLQALKSELAAKLAARQGREGQVEARVRQFSNTWRQRASASGGTLDAQLSYTSPQAAQQQFSIRGLTMASLQEGPREVLAFSVGGANQALRSVNIEPGLSESEIVSRFDRALMPSGIGVKRGENGELVFSTSEASWANVRDSLSVRGSGIRYPTGQMSRVRTDAEPAAIAPEEWNTGDVEALRATLQQVVQALAQLQAARSSVSLALAQATGRVARAQPVQVNVSMDTLAENFTEKASQPGYESLLAISSALVGISRERVVALLGLE
jgi:ABC-type transporter Mla subunit MlaD